MLGSTSNVSRTRGAVASPESATKAEHRLGKLKLSNEFSALDSTRNITIPITTRFSSLAPDAPGETEAKTALRVRGPETLNFYTVGFTSDGSFVVGGTSAPYNLERILTHEAGRWPGLHHTFQSRCTGDGNSIADIPPEASPTYGCPIGRDTY
ncbi:hypothetical protein BDM02DRAFT_3189534 [Thelephora ganbajun]|uniref:Uncharacterized protein n=1 Tax=Thelephora ganbajun TaxID=370292 RepID=A0ACB6Z902_THEGA|nr:hypothetical protein BDM02DRAFT_3189534 [Thelephora ganbajun]